MSSSPPSPSSRRSLRAVVVLLVLLVPAVLAASGAAARSVLDPVLVGGPEGTVRMVLRVPDGATGPAAAVSASVDGVPQPAVVEPLLSDGLAVAYVVDASADGAAVLPSALAGAADLALAAPAGARHALVTDAAPPVVVVPWPTGAADTVDRLGDVRSGGARDTAAALDAAVAQLPAEPAGPRLVVLYTSAPDAGGEPAAAVAERLRAVGAVLAVVATPDGTAVPPFWADVAAATGGTAVAAPPGGGLAPTEQVVSAMTATRLLSTPAPARLPATVVVRVGSSTTEVVVPGTAPDGPRLGVLIAVVAVVALVLVEVVLRRRRKARAALEPAHRSVWSVPPLPEGLLDRDALSVQVQDALGNGRPVWLRAQDDRAGLGTTTALLAYAHRHRDRYDVVWWIPALDPELVPDRLAEFAVALGPATADDPADAATTALLTALGHRGRWLLLFDDAADPDRLGPYLPQGLGDVLIASDDAAWGEVAAQVTVPAFARSESVALLRSGRPDVRPATADGIASTLDDLPLAVAAAAALLVDDDADAVHAHLADAAAARPESERAAVALEVALDRLAGDDPLATALLTLAAWLGPTPVPLSLVTGSRDVLPPPLHSAAGGAGALRDRAGVLGRRGLARATSDDLLVHPVTAALVRGRTGQDHAGSGGWAAIAVRMVRAALPDDPATRADDPAWRMLLPHLLAVTDPARPLDVVAADVSLLLARAGEQLTARGRPDAGRVLLEDARRLAGDAGTGSAAAPSPGNGRPAGS